MAPIGWFGMGRPPGCLVRTIPPGRLTRRSSSVRSCVASRRLQPAGCWQIGVIEQRPHQRRLDALNVHHEVGNGLAEEPMRDDNRRHRRERHHINRDSRQACRCASDTFKLLAAGRDPVELGLAVVLVVHPDVMLDGLDQARRLFIVSVERRSELSSAYRGPSVPPCRETPRRQRLDLVRRSPGRSGRPRCCSPRESSRSVLDGAGVLD
jgi:hypothetical protein